MGGDKEEEKAMTEQELLKEKEMEQKRTMYEISAQNTRETLDILRSLDRMEEDVTNKKLEKSTIEQLDINWKNHRRQQKLIEKRKENKKNKKDKKDEKDKDKNKDKQNDDKGSGNRGRGRG